VAATQRAGGRVDSASEIVEPGLGAKLDDYLSRLSGFGYSGAVLVAKDGRIVLCRGYGLANDSSRTSVTPATVFDIGSLAKQFTAAAVMLLESRGRLSLDDSIDRYLDHVPPDKRAITIHMLLAHTSGMDVDFPFENPTAQDYEEVPRDSSVSRILGMPLVFQPGTAWAYSNPGYVLLAAIVERASGRPFRDFLREELFEPVGMHSTSFWGAGLPAVGDERLARSYDESGQTANLRLRSGTTWFDLGGGEVVSTVGDLEAWMDALLHDRILPASARERMWTKGIGQTGLAWFIDSTFVGAPRIHEGGDYVGFGAELAYHPTEQLVIVCLANRCYDVLGTRYAADRVLPQIVLGRTPEMWPNEPFEVPPRWSRVGAEDARRMAGTYRLSSGGELVLAPGDGALTVSARGQDAVEFLVPASDSAHAEWRRANDRVLEMIRGVEKGDTTVLAATLHPGAEVAVYRHVIADAILHSEQDGSLREMTMIGTVPSAFPRHGLRTALYLRFERGTDVVTLGWLHDRIQNVRGGTEKLAPTPFRSDPGGGFVGWNIVWARTLRLTPITSGGKVVAIRIGVPGVQGALATRVSTEAGASGR
jgi:CubicO group peptidase (beta-lactamase class C family)